MGGINEHPWTEISKSQLGITAVTGGHLHDLPLAKGISVRPIRAELSSIPRSVPERVEMIFQFLLRQRLDLIRIYSPPQWWLSEMQTYIKLRQILMLARGLNSPRGIDPNSISRVS